MKKNLFLSMLAMSGMLFATSCSQDELVNESAGDFVSATFNIGTANGIGSRATIGNGTKADKVVCAVFDAKGEEMDDLRQTLSITDKKAKYSIRLAKGQDYRVAFFAYNEAAAAYDVTDMKNIAVKANQKSNVEDRDAFTAYVDVAATVNAIEKDVTLKRPFAQLNLGVDATEWKDAVKAGVTVTKSYIKVSNVYNAFSAYDNAVVGNEGEMEFAMNKIPTEQLEVDLDRDDTIEEGEYFEYLALNYLLVGDNGAEKSLTDVEFVWETEDGKTNNPTSSFINIPVQRNYRTNIIGKLLTSPADFNIVIDEGFDNSTEDDYIVNEGGENGEVTTVTTTVATAKELQAAIDAAISGNNIIKFEQDIDANSARAAANATITIIQKVGVNLLIDGCNHKFDGTFYLQGGKQGGTSPETLTFRNINFSHADGALDFISADSQQTNIRYAHNVIVENCTFTGNSNGDVVGMRYRQTYNMIVKNSTFTNMHSLMWATGGVSVDGAETIILDNVTVTNSKSGISFGTSQKVAVLNSNFDVTEHGIRADGTAAASMKVENTTINAKLPIIVRELTASYDVALEGNNKLTAGQEYEIIFTNGKDDAEFVVPTGTYTITGAENFNVYPEDANQPVIVDTAEKLKEALEAKKAEIQLAEDAVIEGAFKVSYPVVISSVNKDSKATIKGRVDITSEGDGTSFSNIKFDINNESKKQYTVHNSANYQYPSTANIYAAAVKFEGCEFNVSRTDNVTAINYGSHKAGKMLEVNNCTFKGDFYAIRSRTLFSVTNSDFDIHTDATLAAVFTWGNGNSGANSVTFTGNTNMSKYKTMGVMLSSKTFTYDNIHFDIQKNTDFEKLSDSINPACTVTGSTFAEGSETF